MTATLVRPASIARTPEELGGTGLRVVDDGNAVDLDAAARAVTDLLVALGHDPATEQPR